MRAANVDAAKSICKQTCRNLSFFSTLAAQQAAPLAAELAAQRAAQLPTQHAAQIAKEKMSRCSSVIFDPKKLAEQPTTSLSASQPSAQMVPRLTGD